MAFSAPSSMVSIPADGAANNHCLRLSRRSELCAINFVPIGLSYAKSTMTSGRLPGAIMVSIPERVATSAAIIFVLIPPVPRFVPLPPAIERI